MNEDLREVIPEVAQRLLAESGALTGYREVVVGFCDLGTDEAGNILAGTQSWHLRPEALLPGARSAIAIFLPFAEEIVAGNQGGAWASREWAEAYISTNRLLQRLATVVTLTLQASGHQARSVPPTGSFNRTTLTSDWSHKLIGYLCGLGRYGLHRMLITPLGCAGRLVSLVTTARFESTERPDREPCAYLRDRSCVECINACPVGAIALDGFDGVACFEHCAANAKRFVELPLAEVCGKCAVVRCASIAG